jgi:hypothetical protein
MGDHHQQMVDTSGIRMTLTLKLSVPAMGARLFYFLSAPDSLSLSALYCSTS